MKPALFLPLAMRLRATDCPAMDDAEQSEPQFVEFANHRFQFSFCAFCAFLRLNHHDQRISHLGSEFDVIAQIRFRLLAVCAPQFREGFAIAVFGTNAKMLGN